MCWCRVPRYYPIFLARNHKLVTLVIQQSHEQIPNLRSLVRKVVRDCNMCKRYRMKSLAAACTSKSTLPVFRAELSDAFAVTGVDFAGPVYHKVKKSTTGKAYIAPFSCASTRAVHLKLRCDLSALEFQRALKEFVARRGCPHTIVSDNGKTFSVATENGYQC